MKRDGDELFDHYRHTLEKLGAGKGTLALIFSKAQNKFQDPAKLRRLVVDLIDAENWPAMGADVKGDDYEGLLEKNAQDTKNGAVQYFTPRALIAAMVDCIASKPGEANCDPACGTVGFLFFAHNYVAQHNPNLTRDQKKRDEQNATVAKPALSEIVASIAANHERDRLCSAADASALRPTFICTGQRLQSNANSADLIDPRCAQARVVHARTQAGDTRSSRWLSMAASKSIPGSCSASRSSAARA